MHSVTNTISPPRPVEPVAVVTIDRMPRQPAVAAQVLRALIDHGIVTDVVMLGRQMGFDQLMMTVPAEQAEDAVELIGAIVARFGIGPVSSDPTWLEVTVEAPDGLPEGELVADVFESLARQGIETRAVTANGSTVTCIVRDESSDHLLALAACGAYSSFR
jgi:aspartokinase